MNYDVNTLGASEEELLIKLGYEIFTNTPKHLPKIDSTDYGYVGNALSCNNCHLLGGTKAFAAPLIGIVQRFPQYRGREDKTGTLVERINGCMERSMNGTVMQEGQPQMGALIAYLEWLSRYAPSDGRIEGQGFLKIDIPERPVDLTNGKALFVDICSKCHGLDGKGQPWQDKDGFEYPPLWGDQSYNNGAGMTRVITAAQFIKGNMPYGTVYSEPFLTDAEAYDVAGYINQRLRPIKTNLENDFPNLVKKPVSTPYPPYMDHFPVSQHQLGPFQPIMEFYLTEYGVKKSK